MVFVIGVFDSGDLFLVGVVFIDVFYVDLVCWYMLFVFSDCCMDWLSYLFVICDLLYEYDMWVVEGFMYCYFMKVFVELFLICL